MDGVKGFLASRAIWGGIVALLAGLLGMIGYSIELSDQAQIVEALAALGSMVGGLVAVYGRVRATKKITQKR